MERDYPGLALFIRTHLKAEDIPNYEEAKKFLTSTKDRITQKNINLNDLITMRQLLEYSGQSTSRPSICANVIIFSIGRPLNEAALKEINGGNKKKFAMLYDFANGIISPMETIIMGEAYINGETGKDTNISEAAAALRLDVIDEAEAYLALSRAKQDAAALLRQDPTGFKLLDAPLQYFNEDKHFFPEEQIVFAGIKHSVGLYKEIYPLTENL